MIDTYILACMLKMMLAIWEPLSEFRAEINTGLLPNELYHSSSTFHRK